MVTLNLESHFTRQGNLACLPSASSRAWQQRYFYFTENWLWWVPPLPAYLPRISWPEPEPGQQHPAPAGIAHPAPPAQAHPKTSSGVAVPTTHTAWVGCSGATWITAPWAILGQQAAGGPWAGSFIVCQARP